MENPLGNSRQWKLVKPSSSSIDDLTNLSTNEEDQLNNDDKSNKNKEESLVHDESDEKYIESVSEEEETTESFSENVNEIKNDYFGMIRRYEILGLDHPSNKKDFMLNITVKYDDNNSFTFKSRFNPMMTVRDVYYDCMRRIYKKNEGWIPPVDCETMYDIVIPSSDEENDEIFLLLDLHLWRYAFKSGVVTNLLMKPKLKFHQYDRVSVILKIDQFNYRRMMFHTILKISKVFSRIESRLSTYKYNNISSSNDDYNNIKHRYIYLYQKERGMFLEVGSKSLKDYGVKDMDIIQIKRRKTVELSYQKNNKEHFIILPLDFKVSECMTNIIKCLELPQNESYQLFKQQQITLSSIEEELLSNNELSIYQFYSGDKILIKKHSNSRHGGLFTSINAVMGELIVKSISGKYRYPSNINYKGLFSQSTKKYPVPKMKNGESIQYDVISSVQLFDSSMKMYYIGDIYITNYRIIFTSYCDYSLTEYFLEIPITSVSRSYHFSEKGKLGIAVECKDFRTVQFFFESHLKYLRKRLVNTFNKCLYPNIDQLFAFKYTNTWKNNDEQNGWLFYDPLKEYERLGISIEYKGKNWRISTINKDYSLCDTYPSYLCVPKSITDDDLLSVSKYRSKGRIPVLSWMNKYTGTSITRCSQPLVGVIKKICSEDIGLVNAIREAQTFSSSYLYIIDARPYANAVANIAIGGGFENVSGTSTYQQCSIEFMGIANIHAVRNSLSSLKSLIESQSYDSTFFNKLENTEWLGHISSILRSTDKIVKYIQSNNSCLIHCSDGWDRTSQLTSLSMILLDPFYRTLKGLFILIEKEWCSFGHKFSQRLGHIGVDNVDKNYQHNERSPIFLQFLDCLYQIISQHPYSFEFNELTLRTIAYHSTSCHFGTFLFDSEKERIDNNVKDKTESLWSYIYDEENRHLFINPFYEECKDVLNISYNIIDLKLWNEYYRRWYRKEENLKIDLKYKQLLEENKRLRELLLKEKK